MHNTATKGVTMNSTKIINLNDTKTTETIYKNEKDIINHKTGKVIK